MKREYFEAVNERLNSPTTEPTDRTAGDYRYENPKTGEVFYYKRKGIYRKDGTVLVYKGKR